MEGSVFVAITSLATSAFLGRAYMIEDHDGDVLLISLIVSIVTTVMAIVWSMVFSRGISGKPGRGTDLLKCMDPILGVATPLLLTITFVMTSYLNDQMEASTLIVLAFIAHIATMIVLKFGYDIVTYEQMTRADGGILKLIPYPVFLYALNEVVHNITNPTNDVRSQVFVYIMSVLLGGMEIRKFFSIFLPKKYEAVDQDDSMI